MTKLQNASGWPSLRRASQGLLFAFSISVLLASRLRAADDTTIRPLVVQLLAAGEKNDPQPLLEHGVAGMRIVLDELFPELADLQDNPTKRIALLVEQLGDETFQRREDATAALRRFGARAEEKLRVALKHEDAEVRSRARKLLKDLEIPARSLPPEKHLGLQAYLAKLEDVEAQQELARRVAKALEVRLDQTPKQEALKYCLMAMKDWRTNRVHGELIPLLKLEDPAPAMYAMHHIGKTGGQYVSGLHMAAIVCGRPELIKAGIRAIQGPVFDQENQPRIRAVLEPMFGDSPELAVFRDDTEFMLTAAFYASRDHRIPKARQWIIAMMSKENEKEALRAIQSLGDTGYLRDKLDQELLKALEPHLSSKEAKFRRAALYTLGAYQGPAVQPALIKALADPDKEVWQMAGERLLDQHRFYPKGSSPIPKLLDEALKTSEGPAHRARLEYLVTFYQQESPTFLRWPKEKVK